jgi:hypothetical protein
VYGLVPIFVADSPWTSGLGCGDCPQLVPKGGAHCQLGNRRENVVLPRLQGFVGVRRGLGRPRAAQWNGTLMARAWVRMEGVVDGKHERR